MARQNVRVAEVPLDQGVWAKGSGFAIGPRLRTANNYLNDGLAKVAPILQAEEATAMTAAVALSGIGEFSGTLLVGGRNATRFSVWNGTTGSELTGTNMVATGGITYPFSFAYWPNAAPASVRTPTTYLAQLDDTLVWKTVNGTARTEYAEFTTILGATAPHVSALFVHLDRLWVAQAGTSVSQVYFTDVLRPDIFRSTNFLEIPDEVRGLGRASVADVDVGAQTALVIGARHSIWVLDGNPTDGNAVLRRLSEQVGIYAQQAMATTPLGLFLMGTDGRLYHIPRGATAMIPVGIAIEDATSALGTANREACTLVWASPYLLVHFGTSQTQYVLDLSRPEQPRWWGPTGLAATINVSGAHFLSSNETAYVPKLNGNTLRKWNVGASVPAGTVDLATGFFFEPGHQVEFHRATATLRRAATSTYTVTMTLTAPDGSTRTKAVVIPVVTPSGVDKAITVSFPIADIGALDYFALGFVGSQLGHEWRRLEVEFRVVPRQL